MDKKYWLGLKMCPPFRNRIYRLAELAGGPRALWEMNRRELVALGLTDERATEAIAFRKAVDLEACCGVLAASGVSIVQAIDTDYPEPLRQLPGRPEAIFVKGKLKPYEIAVAIVGARRSTMYGRALAEELAFGCAEAGIVVVSGGARGIDTAAHTGALAAGGVTHVVLGCGIDIVYPPENRTLFQRIEETGAVISEFPPGTAPLPQHFPTRNRVVAGMCQATVVVEAGEKSGALITADFALEYGRDVFAVPGFTKSETSKGANKLIKQGAFLVESVEDVFDVLKLTTVIRRETEHNSALSEKELQLLEVMGWEPNRFDELSGELDSTIAELSTLLLVLEINGYIKKDLAGSYIRIR